jgi:hypothetical protein
VSVTVELPKVNTIFVSCTDYSVVIARIKHNI